MKSAIAENTKRIIQEKGWKQIAKRAGYTPAAFNNILNGRKIITDCDVSIIAKALGVTPNELLGFNNPA